jgi:hypothetical protein
MKRWHVVTMNELREIWKEQQLAGVCYNGCTHDALVQRYGERNIKHKRGYGWYKLVERVKA